MATRKSYHERPTYIYLGEERQNSIPSDTQFEFDESDFYNNSNEVIIPSETKNQIPNSRSSRKQAKKGYNLDRKPLDAATSLPVIIPEWSKIVRGEEYNKNRRESDDDDDDDEGERVPPHEYLARTRTASFSVHEGIGRTLKGRDLSRVRNAIWKQIGFED